MPTPHNIARQADIGYIIIMAGDLNRARKITEKFLTNAKLVNDIRGVQTYTGYWKGQKVTVTSHGMGCPSMGIYAHEYFGYYKASTIIRVGTIGALREDIDLGQIIIVKESYTKTNLWNYYEKNGAGFVRANKILFDRAVKAAKKLNVPFYEGRVYCSDSFYTDEDQVALAKEHNLLGVEMESAALYLAGEKFNKKALTICCVSDNVVTGEQMKAEEKEDIFDNMVEVALVAAFNK